MSKAAWVAGLALILLLFPSSQKESPGTRITGAGGLPSSMASAGDSITAAFDVGWCCVLKARPRYSWSTGTDDSVHSHYERLVELHSPIRGHVRNYAEPGAKMADLEEQLRRAAAAKVDYLTILIGANDICTSSISTMTPVRSFRISFLGALKYFTAHNPGARILVGSIPNIPRLRRVLERVPQARAVWDVYGICQSTLAGANTPAQRRRVAMQERAYNETLAGVCRQFTQCRWDGGAVYAFKFSADDVSSVDYFHPSRRGQNHLASITWQAGYWPEEP